MILKPKSLLFINLHFFVTFTANIKAHTQALCPWKSHLNLDFSDLYLCILLELSFKSCMSLSIVSIPIMWFIVVTHISFLALKTPHVSQMHIEPSHVCFILEMHWFFLIFEFHRFLLHTLHMLETCHINFYRCVESLYSSVFYMFFFT